MPARMSRVRCCAIGASSTVLVEVVDSLRGIRGCTDDSKGHICVWANETERNEVSSSMSACV